MKRWKIILFLLCLQGTLIAQEVIDKLTIEEFKILYDTFEKFDNQSNTISQSVESHYKPLFFDSAYSHGVVYSTNDSDVTNILILVEEFVYNQCVPYIKRYAQDLYYAFNKCVTVEIISNENHIQIRDLLKYYYSKGLQGAVLVGDLSYASFEQIYEGSNSSWPCDFYYMDLNGNWIDSNANNIYDLHSGNKQHEIFVSRIPIRLTSPTDIDILKEYFDKNHSYWRGGMQIKEQSALGYIDSAWVAYDYFQDVNLLYDQKNYTICKYGYSDFGSVDYCQRLIADQFEFVQIATHADAHYHYFAGNDTLSIPEFFVLEKHPIAYNLFCCSACNWSQEALPTDFIGGAYLFSQGRGLTVVGSAKNNASMLEFRYFYSPLSLGHTIGQSFKTWWNKIDKIYDSDNDIIEIIRWFYGMTIIGDPFVSMKYNTNTTCQETLVLTKFDNTIESDLCYYRASERIEVGGNYVIPVGKHVIFDAPEIAFLPGFQCPVGATFETRTEGCECNHITTPQRNNAPRRIDQTKDESTETLTEQITDFQVYPNPVQDILQITSSEPIEAVIIYTLSGEKVLQARSTQVDVSNLKEGMYIVQATSQAGRHFTAKVVKQ